MKKLYLTLLLYFILFLQNVKSDHCSSYIEQLLENTCSSITVNSSHSCAYSNGKCIYKYKTCESYQGKDQSICESIIPNELGYKCKLNENEKCSKVEKYCNEYDSQNIESCTKLKTSNDEKKICVESPSGLGCKEQYKTCGLYNDNEASKNKEDCESIKIYSDLTDSFDDLKKCSFSGGVCSEKSIRCSDFNDELVCSLAPLVYTLPENKTCVYKNNKCHEVYKTCELYNNNEKDENKNKEDCESIYEERDAADYNCVFNSNNKTCSSVRKKCSDFKNYYNCLYFRPVDESKRCVYVNGSCVEHFKTCELYDKEPNKEKKICESIVPLSSNYYSSERDVDKNSKCVFDEKENQCLKKKKGCSEITGDMECKYYEPEDRNKMCVYNSNTRECKEEFKSCSSFNNVNNKNAEDCKKINIYSVYNSINYRKKCVYENEYCKEKDVTNCDDYDPALGEDFCKRIYINSYKGCKLKDDKCVEYYINCPGEIIDEETCNSINTDYSYYKCEINENKECISVKKKCSEYEGSSEYYCKQCEPTDDKKKCFFKNDKCIEKYIHCEDYTGKDSKECESIIPYDNNDNSLYYTHKCLLVGDICQQIQKNCSDATYSYECSSIISPTDYTKCVYKNDKCFEQYRNCESYNSKSNGKTKEECESIPTDSSLTKCIFTDNICKEVEIKCPDYEINMDSYKSSCEQYSPSLDKKCSYTNSVCTESNKSCKELENQSGVNEDICTLATTSQSGKICTLNTNGDGCQEIGETEKNQNTHDTNTNTTNTNTTKDSNKKSSGKSIYLNPLLFIIFFII